MSPRSAQSWPPSSSNRCVLASHSAGVRELAHREQLEGHPERAASGSRDIVLAQALVMRARPEIGADVVLTGQKRGDRQPLEVAHAERCKLIGRRQLRVDLAPGLLTERLRTVVWVSHGHGPPHRGEIFHSSDWVAWTPGPSADSACSPSPLGWLFMDATGGTSGAFLILAAFSLGAAALCLVLRRQAAFTVPARVPSLLPLPEGARA